MKTNQESKIGFWRVTSSFHASGLNFNPQRHFKFNPCLPERLS